MASNPTDWMESVSDLLGGDERYAIMAKILDFGKRAKISMADQASAFEGFATTAGIPGCKRSTFFALKKLWFDPGTPIVLNEVSVVNDEAIEAFLKSSHRSPKVQQIETNKEH